MGASAADVEDVGRHRRAVRRRVVRRHRRADVDAADRRQTRGKPGAYFVAFAPTRSSIDHTEGEDDEYVYIANLLTEEPMRAAYSYVGVEVMGKTQPCHSYSDSSARWAAGDFCFMFFYVLDDDDDDDDDDSRRGMRWMG